MINYLRSDCDIGSHVTKGDKDEKQWTYSKPEKVCLLCLFEIFR